MSPEGRISRRANIATKTGRTNGKACERCHYRKVRCDMLQKGAPCSNCVAHDIKECKVFEKRKSRPKSPSDGGVTLAPLQPRLERQHPATAPATPSLPHLRPDAANQLPTSGSSLVERRASACDASEQVTRNLADFINREDLRNVEITHRCRLYFIGTEFSNLNHILQHRSRWPNESVLHFGSLTFPARTPSMPSGSLELPNKGLADELVEAYFTHVNRGFPIVDEIDFKRSYYSITNRSTPSIKPVSLLLLNALFLVGAHALAPHREDIKALRPVFFSRTKTIFDKRYEKHREAYLQTALLLTWQCEDLEDVVSNSWHWIGVAARTAFGLGIHRNANPSNLNVADKRLWIRLWWIVFQFDVVISAAYGRPQAINLQDSDVPMLELQHFDGVNDAQTDFTIQHTRLCVIFSKAMRQRSALRSTPDERAAATKEADEALAEFILQLPENLRFSTSSPSIWPATLHLSYNNFLILLHRRKNPEQQVSDIGSDSGICWSAVNNISSIFESLRTCSMLHGLWLPSIHVLFTAMVHLSINLNDPNPVIAAQARRPFESLLSTLREAAELWVYAQSLLALFEPRPIRPTARLEEPAHRSGPAHLFLSELSPLPQNDSGPREEGAPQHEASMHGAAYEPQSPSYQEAVKRNQQARDSHQDQLLSGSLFASNELGMTDLFGGVDTLALPSELEFLLAGVGTDYEF